MRVYGINGSIYSNSCYSDDLEEVAVYVAELLKISPQKTIIQIIVTDVPKEVFEAYPKFEGFKLIGDIPNDGTD